MKTQLIFGLTLGLLALALSCNKSDEDDGLIICPVWNCEDVVQVNEDLYDNGPNDQMMIADASIHEDCLEVTFRYGGGCGEVATALFASLEIGESLPPQRFIRIGFTDNDNCEALLSLTKTFDLSPLREVDDNVILINLEGYDEVLEYSY